MKTNKKNQFYLSLQNNINTMITQMIKYMIYIVFFFLKRNPKTLMKSKAVQQMMTVGRLWEQRSSLYL